MNNFVTITHDKSIKTLFNHLLKVGGWRDSMAARALAVHMANFGLIPDILYDPPSSIKSNS